MVVKAIGSNIIVRKHIDTIRSKSSTIVIPEGTNFYKLYVADELSEVVAIGNDYPYKDDIKIGDMLVCQKTEGRKIYVDNQELWVMREAWVHGKVNKND
jgi:co-chaperonin GroES (HSP10)